jgi:flagellar biosynthesis/type III secretory pathway chaperone
MEKLIAILTELLLLQRAQLAVGRELIAAVDSEEAIAETGFSVHVVQDIVDRKDQIIHRFAGLEQKRRSLAGSLAFLISLDTRNAPPTLSNLVAALGVYGENVKRVLDADTLAKVTRAIEIYSAETRAQIPSFEVVGRRVQRNRLIIGRLRESVQRTARFFEQAAHTVDFSYDKGGKLRTDKSRARRNAHVAVKA